MKNKDIELEILKATLKALDDVADDLVFTGGSTISLYITEPQAVQIRETFDVDCVVEANNLLEYQEVVDKIKSKGFIEDPRQNTICRYRNGDLILDLLPTDAKILGFTNKWYSPGLRSTLNCEIDDKRFRILSLPYLIASKIEAFKGRGKGSYLSSTDIEDIITLFDGRSSIAMDLSNSPTEIKIELNKELFALINDRDFLNSIEAHISDRTNSAGRKTIVLSRIQAFINSR